MWARRAVGFALAVNAAVVLGELPPGYLHIVQVTNEYVNARWPRINNHGQVVFRKANLLSDGSDFDGRTAEIYLYDSRTGAVTRLTNDDIYDDTPCINDRGEIAWSRAIGTNGTLEIVVYRDGQLTRLTYDEFDDRSPWINNFGQVAWYKVVRGGCLNANSKICFYDGRTVHEITDGTIADQELTLNDAGDIVWTRCDYCPWPMWRADIMMYSDGIISELTRDQYEPQCPYINNQGVVVWDTGDPPHWVSYVQIWREGVTTTLPLDEARNAVINDRGDIVMNRWHEELWAWHIWLYRDGRFWQITTGPEWNAEGHINNAGDIVWTAGDAVVGALNVFLLRRARAGDLNCDGFVNTFDIDAFVLALTDPAGYAAAYPRCDSTLADANDDGSVNAFDIDSFVNLLQR